MGRESAALDSYLSSSSFSLQDKRFLVFFIVSFLFFLPAPGLEQGNFVKCSLFDREEPEERGGN